MTISQKLPVPGSIQNGLMPFIRASIAGQLLSPITRTDVTIYVSGFKAVDAGVVNSNFTASFLSNSLFGIDVVVRPKAPLGEDLWHSVRVVTTAHDESWSFRCQEVSGPRIANISPTTNSDGAPSWPRVEFDIVDDVGDVQRRVLKSESNDGVRSGSQLHSDTINFKNSIGGCVEVDGIPAFVIAELGPNDVVLSTSGGGSGLNVKLFEQHGIDVVINGNLIIRSGEVFPENGWSTIITEPVPGQFHVNAQKIGDPIPQFQRVEVEVRARDDNSQSTNVTTARSHFFIGDKKGPRAVNVSPRPGTRGLSTGTGTQPVIDIVDLDAGVSLSSIFIKIDNISAVSSGLPVGNFSTTTVTPITGGFRVVIKKGTAWPSEKEVSCMISASDRVGNSIPPTVWLWHFGNVIEQSPINFSGGHLVSDDVKHVVAFDFSHTLFANPIDSDFTGFASDGYYYVKGGKNPLMSATWATESSGVNRSSRRTFPLSGYLVCSSSSWSIIDSAGRMWMKCSGLLSGSSIDWSMAGGIGQAVTAGDHGKDRPVFFIATGPNIVVVNFETDMAVRVTSDGASESTGSISQRNSNQSGNVPDQSFQLSASVNPFISVCGLAFNQSWLIAGCRDQQIEMAGVIDNEFKSEIELHRGPISSQSNSVILEDIDFLDWAKICIKKRNPEKLQPLIAASTGISPRLLTCDWVDVFLYLGGYLDLMNVGVALDEARDCAQVFDKEDNWLVAFASRDNFSLLAVDGDGLGFQALVSKSKIDLTLDTVVGGEISACCLDEGITKTEGLLYVAASSTGSGKVVRYRHQPASASGVGQLTVIDSGTPVSSISALGETRLVTSRFIRASMSMLAAGESFVNASMTVE